MNDNNNSDDDGDDDGGKRQQQYTLEILSFSLCVYMTAYRMSCFDGWLVGGSMLSSLSVEMMPKTVNVSKNFCRQSVVKYVSTKVLAALQSHAFRYSQILKSLNESSKVA